jgi:para-nitrobenzyl esterase
VPAFRQNEWKSGAIHSAELMFSFDSIETSGWAMSKTGKADAADRDVAKLVNSCWVAFYKMDAKATSFTCANGTTWPAYTDAGDAVMQFKAAPQVAKSKTIANGPPRPTGAGS